MTIRQQKIYRYEAYQPETNLVLAVGLSHKPDAVHAVVSLDLETGKHRIVSVYGNVGVARRLASSITNKKTRRGILCEARRTGQEEQ